MRNRFKTNTKIATAITNYDATLRRDKFPAHSKYVKIQDFIDYLKRTYFLPFIKRQDEHLDSKLRG